MPPFRKKLLLAPLLPLLAMPVAAQENRTTSRQFDTLTVTATRQEERVGDVPGTVSVVDQDRIDRENIKDIRSLVRYEPGVSVGGTGSRFGADGFTIRGIGGNRVLTQVDGIGVPDAFSFGPFMNARRDYVDLDTVKRVEIIRGPASSLYGSDAIGGAVSFLTKDAGDYLGTGDDSYGRLKGGYDSSDNSWLRSGTLAGRRGSVDALLHMGRRSGNETETQGGRGGIGGLREEANPVDYTSDNLLSKLGWDYSSGGRVQLVYERFANETDTRVLSEYSQTGLTRTSDAQDEVDRERFALEHRMALDLAAADQLSWQLARQTSETRQRTLQNRVVGGQPAFRTRDSRYEENLWALSAQLENAFSLGDTQHRLIYGVDLKRTTSADLRQGQQTLLTTGVTTRERDISDFPDPRIREYAIFAQDSLDVGRWTVTPGLRFDRFQLDPRVTQRYLNSGATNDDPQRYRDSALSPKLAVSYALDDAHSIYAQYAAGFRAPQAVDIFGEFENPGQYRTVANLNLKPETSDSYETGLRGEYAQGSFGIALFYNRYDDFIEQQRRPSSIPGFPFGEFQSVNIDSVTIYGAEARGELYLDQWGLPLGTHSRASVAWARGKDDSSGQPINSIDPLKGVFGLGYDEPNGRFGTELVLTLAAAKTRVDESATSGNAFRTPGYGVVDLLGYWQLSDALEVNAGLYNLTDKRYWNWTDVRTLADATPGLGRFTQPGRHAAVNLVWEF